MSKECVCIAIDDVYGQGWLTNHGGNVALDKYDWEFRFAVAGDKVVDTHTSPITVTSVRYDKSPTPLIVILGEKKPVEEIPGLYEAYNVRTLAEVEATLSKDWKSTGEFRNPEEGEYFVGGGGGLSGSVYQRSSSWSGSRGLQLNNDEKRLVVVENVVEKPDYEKIAREWYANGRVAEGYTPGGWERTGEIKPPTRGEFYLDFSGCPRESNDGSHEKNNAPRYIVRRKVDEIAKMYGKPLAEIKIPEGWECTGEFGKAEAGDTFLTYETHQPCFTLAGLFPGPRLILRKKKDPVEEVYGKPLNELNAPEGFEFTGEFKIPAVPDYFLGKGSYGDCGVMSPGDSWVSGCSGRLILRKLSPPPHPTITSVYGTEDPKIPVGWVKTGKFRRVGPGDYWLSTLKTEYIGPFKGDERKDLTCHPWLILRRLTLSDIYGSDSVTLPVGYDWTGEFRFPRQTEVFVNLAGYGVMAAVDLGSYVGDGLRLILTPTTRKKVRFIAEETPRLPKKKEWFLNSILKWEEAGGDFTATFCICATREETPDPTPQVVTQADVDKIWEGK